MNPTIVTRFAIKPIKPSDISKNCPDRLIARAVKNMTENKDNTGPSFEFAEASAISITLTVEGFLVWLSLLQGVKCMLQR